MTARPLKALVLGDDASIAADLAWLWINCHEWPGRRLEIVTAAAATDYRVDPDWAKLRTWTPPDPRRPFTESKLADIVALTCTMDPRLALSRSADLLVVGHRGPGLAKSMQLGSTPEWLLAHPPAPMLIARHCRRTQTAVLCADGSAHALAAATALCSLAWIRDVTVTIASVDDGTVDVERAVGAVTDLLAATGARVRRRDLRGEPTHELLALLEDEQPDLVVLGTRGLTGIHRIRVGSTAGAVAQAVECSVLLACDETVTDPSIEVVADRAVDPPSMQVR